jgi:hypothetical protein
MVMDVTQDHAAMLPAGDFDRLDKREKEAFCTLQEEAVRHLLKASNEFQLRFPGLKLEWRFQADVYQDVSINPATIRYSPRVY